MPDRACPQPARAASGGMLRTAALLGGFTLGSRLLGLARDNYMPLLIVSTYLSCIAAFYGSVYVVCKESKKAGVTSFIAAVVNLVVHFALITWLGLHAAVISTFVSFLVLTLYRAYDINKHYYKMVRHWWGLQSRLQFS